jgi:exonuclease III
MPTLAGKGDGQFSEYKSITIRKDAIKRKKDMWSNIRNYASVYSDTPSIIIGDFNEYCMEDAQTSESTLLHENLICLELLDWVDVWKESEQKKRGDRYTWYSVDQKGKKKNGFRLDYAFVSPALLKKYDASVRHLPFNDILSDHGPLILDLKVKK